ncbi:hypothetical protein NDU88_000762 [Pleurodeles waltl]|uniref:Uncharacterized protein n=1 Tax=Pleurodeles waltl TaxID=8319 RepID=A0AAV7WGF1_PLEWA|nr:hypothetical protein NDU88_000762 [Pleurodeles waltl]
MPVPLEGTLRDPLRSPRYIDCFVAVGGRQEGRTVNDTRLEQVESRTTDLEDGRRGEGEWLLQMEQVLKVIQNKN